MTGRERLLNTIEGRETDRVPVSPFIWSNTIGEFFGSESVDMVEKGIEVYRHFGFDVFLRTCNVGALTDEKSCDSKNWRVTETTVQTGEKKWETTTTVRTPERELTQRMGLCRITPYEVVQAQSEYFIKEEKDFEQFVKYQPPVPQADCGAVRRARELLGDDGIAAPWIQGAFNSLGMMRKLEDLLMDPYENESLFEGMCEYFPSRMREAARQLTAAGADVICAGGNMATATMVGPSFFREHLLALETEHCQKIRAMGVHYLYHNCGDAAALLPYYSDIGMSVYESMTPPPYGDTELSAALTVIDHGIALCGNLDQVSFLREASPEQVRERTRGILELAKPRGRFILGTTDYLSEGTPEENIRAFAEAGVEYGGHL